MRISGRWMACVAVTVGIVAVLLVVSLAMAEGPELEGGGGNIVRGAISYQGVLKEDGAPVNGIRLMKFALHGSAGCSGVAIWESSTMPVQVTNGLFTVAIDGVQPGAFWGGALYLEVIVGIGETTIDCREILPVPYAMGLRPGAWIESEPRDQSGAISGTGWVVRTEMDGAYDDGKALYGVAATGSAVYGESAGGKGVYGYTENLYGVYGRDAGSVQAQGYGGYFTSDNGVGVYGYSNGTRTHPNIYSPGVYGRSAHGVGVYGRSDESAATWTSAGVMGYGYADPGGKFFSYSGNPLEAWEDEYGDGYTLNLRFKVNYSGNVYADGTYYGAGGVSAGSADFAEMVPPGEVDLEPGDVLAIGPQGEMIRSSEPYQPTVAGVYSTEPGFIAGNKLDDEGNPLEPDRIPMAIVGIVPVKASAENGPIQPGDLLAASSIPGHAMRAGADPPPGTVIGKALEGLGSGTGVIQLLVTLR